MEKKIIKIDRYLHYKDKRVIDLLWKPYMLQELSNAGIKDEFFSSSEIMRIVGKTQRNIRRLELLKAGEYLIFKKLKPNGKTSGVRYAYTFSGKSKSYLEKYTSFTNPDGWLMQKIFKICFVETKIETKTVIKEIIKEVPVEKEIEFQTEEKVKEGW